MRDYNNYEFNVLPFGLCNGPTTFQCLHEAKLKLQVKKCVFGKATVKILGHVISSADIATD